MLSGMAYNCDDREDGSREIDITATRWRLSPCFRFWRPGVRCARDYSERDP